MEAKKLLATVVIFIPKFTISAGPIYGLRATRSIFPWAAE